VNGTKHSDKPNYCMTRGMISYCEIPKGFHPNNCKYYEENSRGQCLWLEGFGWCQNLSAQINSTSRKK